MFSNVRLVAKNIIFLLLAELIISCGTVRTSMYSFDYPLTSEVAKSQSSVLNVKIPQGWFTAQDNENNFIDLWLIKDDYSANLQFIQLNLDSLTKKETAGKGLSKVAALSKDFKCARFGKALGLFTNDEIFELNNTTYIAYQYLDDDKKNIRVVVFQKGNMFYELTAIPNKTNDNTELFRIQNSVLSSIN